MACLLVENGIMCVSGGPYKPGDPPPAGYCDQQEWAAAQYKAGLRQQKCRMCGKWKFPQKFAVGIRCICLACEGENRD